MTIYRATKRYSQWARIGKKHEIGSHRRQIRSNLSHYDQDIPKRDIGYHDVRGDMTKNRGSKHKSKIKRLFVWVIQTFLL